MARIGLFIEMQYGYGAPIVRGVIDFARGRPDWQVNLFDVPAAGLADEMLRWDWDGAIVTVVGGKMLEVARGQGRPVVNASGAFASPGIVAVHGDDRAIGRMAGEYLLERRFERLLGVYNSRPSAAFGRRIEGFVAACQEAGREPEVLDVGDMTWQEQVVRLKEVRPPTAAFCAEDRTAVAFLRAAQIAGLEIPDDLAVVGAGNDEMICELVHPTLSSVDGNLRQRGYDTAAMLERLLRGERPAEDVVLVPPREVVSRQSTDVYALQDRGVVAALRYIREHLGEEMRIEQIAEAAEMSRRSLEIRHRKAQGRSVQQEIWHQRVVAAKRLLRRQDKSVTEIAYACGFASASALSVVFRREAGVTPREFRAKVLSPVV